MMNHKRLKLEIISKKIGGISLLVIVLFCLSFYAIRNTFAENEKKDSKSDNTTSNSNICIEENILLDKYGPQLTVNENGEYFLSLKSNVDDTAKKNANNKRKFIVETINNKAPAEKIVVSGSDKSPYNLGKLDPISVNISENAENPVEEKQVIVTMRIDPSTPDDDCKANVKLTLVAHAAPGSVSQTFSFETVDSTYTPSNSELLDCENNFNNLNGFNKEICKAKLATQENYKDNNTSASDGKNNIKVFKCNANTFMKENDITKSDETYYGTPGNHGYLYANKEYNLDGTYTYNVDSNYDVESKSWKKTEKTTCKIKCEEGVKVEYGPPIASKAGLCFEYKVKVTSRVRCATISKPNPPKTKFNVCTPSALCVSKNGMTWKQGGPNEDFEKCINKCDGGKYTESCSNKCYKKVYGSSTTIKTSDSKSNASLTGNYTTSKLSNKSPYDDLKCPEKENERYGGCYKRSVNGTISWRNPGYNTLARFYQLSNSWMCNRTFTFDHLNIQPGECYGINYQVDGIGIPRHHFASGYVCSDSCYWLVNQCEKPYYLNYGVAEKDYEKNLEVYNSLKSQCESATKCTTSSATFTIQVNYKKSNSESVEATTTEVKFPYDKKDTVASCNKGDGEASTNTTKCDNSNGNIDPNSFVSNSGKDNNLKNGCHVTDNGSSLLGYAGCYSSDSCPESDYYMTEWTIPGTWLGNKNGLSISYSSKKPGVGWRYQKNKFCTPFDSGNVNEEWWKTYYAHILSKGEIDKYNENLCDNAKIDYDSEQQKDPTAITNSVKDWNIIAETSKFGYFNWNIQIQCFYAQFKDDTCGKTTNARVRTVDLNNLFPGSNEDPTKGSSSSATTKESGTTRNIGFNWTSKANIKNTLSDGKKEQFTSNPEEYLKNVQEKGYSIYNDENLDYQFTITPSELRKIKKTLSNSDNNYTKFDGTTKKGSGGVSRYTSNLIHGSSDQSLIKEKIVPSDYDCNNMINHSKGCQSNNNGGN